MAAEVEEWSQSLLRYGGGVDRSHIPNPSPTICHGPYSPLRMMGFLIGVRRSTHRSMNSLLKVASIYPVTQNDGSFKLEIYSESIVG